MRRPNILLLYTDQQRWDALGANRNARILTPNLDRLSAAGVNCDHCFVQNPVCMPSRVSMLSGRYCSSLGIYQNGVPVPEDLPTLPSLLTGAGYRTANLGKLHFLPHANRDHRLPHPAYGFTHLEISDEPGPYEDAYRAWVRATAPEELDRVSLGLPPMAQQWYRWMGVRDCVTHPNAEDRFAVKGPVPFAGRDEVTHTAFVADRTIDFLETYGAEPFCCIAGFYSPHSPWVVPRRFLYLYDPDTFELPEFPPEIEARRGDTYPDHELCAARHGYWAMVSEVDHHVGRILDALEASGQADNTIVVFTSDHGEWLGDHLKYGKGYPAHDCVSRVPLLVRWPNGPVGQRYESMVEHVDLVPTLLESVGLQVPPFLQGRSIAPLAKGESPVPKQEALVEMRGATSLRSDRYRYIVHQDGRELLFDLAAEFGDYRDVSQDAAHTAALADHRHRLLRRWLGMARPLPRTWAY